MGSGDGRAGHGRASVCGTGCLQDLLFSPSYNQALPAISADHGRGWYAKRQAVTTPYSAARATQAALTATLKAGRTGRAQRLHTPLALRPLPACSPEGGEGE